MTEPGRVPSDAGALAGADPEPAPEPESEPEPDLREEMGVLREDLKGTMAATPGQRIRLLVLVVVVVVVLLGALMAMRAAGSGPFAGV